MRSNFCQTLFNDRIILVLSILYLMPKCESTVPGYPKGGTCKAKNAEGLVNVFICKCSFVKRKFHDPIFILARQNNRKGTKINAKNKNSMVNLFDKTKKVVFCCHGWLDPVPMNFPTMMKLTCDSILDVEDCNVIYVTYGFDNKKICFADVVDYIMKWLVPMLRDFIRDVIQGVYGISSESTYCIGHSAGTEVCGYAGAMQKFKTIIAIDPALPCIYNKTPEERLSPNSAHCVIVLYTGCGGRPDILPVCPTKFPPGILMGHKTIYANGGSFQPGCSRIKSFHLFLQNPLYPLPYFLDCSHCIGCNYIAEALSGKGEMYAVKCDSCDDFKNGKCGPCICNGKDANCIKVGFDTCPGRCNSSIEEYYLITRKTSPFLGHQYKINIKLCRNSPITFVKKIGIVIKGSNAEETYIHKREKRGHAISLDFIAVLKHDVGKIISVSLRWHQCKMCFEYLIHLKKNVICIKSIQIAPIKIDCESCPGSSGQQCTFYISDMENVPEGVTSTYTGTCR